MSTQNANDSFLADPLLIVELMKNISEGIYLIRLDNNTIIYANERFEKMFGYAPGEIIGKDVSIINTQTDKTPEETNNSIVDVLNKTGEWHGEVENIKKDGTHFWCYVNVSLFEYSKYGKVIVSVHTDITKQKNIENEHVFNETLLSIQQEASDTGILTVNENGKIINYNKRFIEMWGIPQSILESKSDEKALQFVMEKLVDSEEFIKKVKYLYENKDQISKEVIDLKDGRVFDRYSSPVFDKNKKYYGRVWRFQDITDRKKAEEYKTSLLKAIPDMMFRLDKNGVFLDYKAQINDLYTNPDNIIGKQIGDILPTDIADLTKKTLKLALDTKKIQLFEYSLIMPDKKTYDYEARMINSGPDEVIAIVRDITERKQKEELLKKSNELYTSTITAINDGVWDWNVQTGNAFFSEAYYKILGYENKEFPANYATWKTLVHPDDIEQAEKELQQGVVSNKGFNINLRMKMKSGEWLWVSTRGKAIEKDKDEKTIRMVGTLTDITEQKKAEKIIKGNIDEVEEINKLMVNRELKMVELKKEIEKLKKP